MFTTATVIIAETERIPSCRAAGCERGPQRQLMSVQTRNPHQPQPPPHPPSPAPLHGCNGNIFGWYISPTKQFHSDNQTEADYDASAGGDKSSQITTFKRRKGAQGRPRPQQGAPWCSSGPMFFLFTQKNLPRNEENPSFTCPVSLAEGWASVGEANALARR